MRDQGVSGAFFWFVYGSALWIVALALWCIGSLGRGW
jgi:hypothetical protein